MKVIKSKNISAFGGINFVFNQLNQLGIPGLLQEHLPALPPQSQYTWKDIVYGFWAIFYCGGDCMEDLSINLKDGLKTPLTKIPSPDTVLRRFKAIAGPTVEVFPQRGSARHFFSFNEALVKLNLKLFKRLNALETPLVLDYDNTPCFTEKADANYTYHKATGYMPGVAFIGPHVVYLENRNGNSDAQTLQQETFERMFEALAEQGIKISYFRADSASYQFLAMKIIHKHVEKFYIKARAVPDLLEQIKTIKDWKPFDVAGVEYLRGEATYRPLTDAARRHKMEPLPECRIIVTKTKRKDKQINAITGEAYIYSTMVTNDFEGTPQQIVGFYNKRGAIEREFDVLKNDFGWNKLPCSYLNQNTVYLLFTSMCKNIYNYLIRFFSQKHPFLQPNYRLKKFIFRFICIPAKWIYRSRQWHLKLFGNHMFDT